MQPKDDQKYFSAITTNTITSDDYDRFMKGKPLYTIDELKQRVPESVIEVFLKQDADKLVLMVPKTTRSNFRKELRTPYLRY